MQQHHVGLAGQNADAIVSGLEQLHGNITVMQVCLDVAELAALAGNGSIDVAVIVEQTEHITLSLMQRFHEQRVAVVVLTDVASERQRCFFLGAEVAGTQQTPQQLAELILQSLRTTSFAPRTDLDTDLAGVEPADFLVHPPPVEESVGVEPDQEEPIPEGQVITFWGPMGSPGTTTLAVNAAAEYAIAGKNTLLIDADTHAASVTAMLGLLEESSGLSQLCRLAELGTLTEDSFQKGLDTVTIGPVNFGVLSGIPHPARWPELRRPALEQVLALARKNYDVIVVDTAGPLDQDEELSFDVVVPQRNAATLFALEQAELVFAVGTADVVQLPRLLRLIPDLLEVIGPHTSVRYVVNKVDEASVGGQAEEQLRYSWARFSPASSEEVEFLPAAGNVLSQAMLAGQTLAEAAKDDPLRQAVQGLLGVPVQQRRGLLPRWLNGTKDAKSQAQRWRRKPRGRRAKV